MDRQGWRHVPHRDGGPGEVTQLRPKGSINQKVWEAASGWHHGLGTRYGVDLTTINRHLQRLRRAGEHAKAAVLKMVCTGSLWPASRRFGREGGREQPAAAAQPEQPTNPVAAAAAPDPGPAPAAPAPVRHDMDQEELEVDFDLEARTGCQPYEQYDDDMSEAEDYQDQWAPAAETPPEHFTDRCDAWNSDFCPRCGEEEETTFHQLWECPCNDSIAGTHPELVERARHGSVEAPCFWLRGLPPLHWVYDYCMLPTQRELQFTQCRPTNPLQLPVGAFVATDGSGGAHSSDPRLRRCGWGFAVYGPTGDLLGTGSGPLHSWRQTVPLAELEAAKAAVSLQRAPSSSW